MNNQYSLINPIREYIYINTVLYLSHIIRGLVQHHNNQSNSIRTLNYSFSFLLLDTRHGDTYFLLDREYSRE